MKNLIILLLLILITLSCEEIEITTESKNVYTIEIAAVDKSTREIIENTMFIVTLNDSTVNYVISDETGIVSLQLEEGNQYLILIRAENYLVRYFDIWGPMPDRVFVGLSKFTQLKY